MLSSLFRSDKKQVQSDECVEMAANIDDMTPQDISVMMKILLSAGALDVWFENIQMKKNRPAVKLCVLSSAEKSGELSSLILKHTTSLGVRMTNVRRFVLQRSIETEDTTLGQVRIKRAFGFGVEKKSLEFDDILRIAEERGMSISEVRSILAREDIFNEEVSS